MRTALISFLLLLALLATAAAQDTKHTDAPGTEEVPIIQDNSFLVEEAYNQEDGVIQHISTFQRLSRSHDWAYTFTDEWPLRTQKHQLSVTFSQLHSGDFGSTGLGDTAFNYRYQLVGSGETKLAISPRLTLIAPTGNYRYGRSAGGFGLQTNLPVSIQLNKYFVTHWNAGATWTPNARNVLGDRARTVAVNLGQSTIWTVNPRFNVLMETAWTSSEDVILNGKTTRAADLLLNPGVRWAYNFKSGLQIVPGVSMPIGAGPSAGEKGVMFYLSFEHPFQWAHSK